MRGFGIAIIAAVIGLVVWVLLDPPQTPDRPHQIGEGFSVGYWAYRCNGVQWRPGIGEGFTAESPDAAFLVVDLTVQNNDRSESVLPPPKLIDEQGREFGETPKAALMNGSFGIMKSLNPGVSSRRLVVFDVPPNGRYMLQVSGGIESGEHAVVSLMESPRPGPQTTPEPTISQNTAAKIKAQLLSEPDISELNIQVTESEDEVRLTGTVPDYAVRLKVYKAATAAAGAKKINDQLHVVGSSVKAGDNSSEEIGSVPLAGEPEQGSAKVTTERSASIPGDNGVGYPSCLYCPEPQYTDEARAAKIQGNIVLRVIIQPDGHATEIVVTQSLGYGLDERAIDTVRSWRFKPAAGPDGTPVATITPIEMTFRLR